LRYAVPHLRNNALAGAAAGRALRLINQPRIYRIPGLSLALRRAAFTRQRPYGRGRRARAAVDKSTAHLPGTGAFPCATPRRIYAATPLRARLLGGV